MCRVWQGCADARQQHAAGHFLRRRRGHWNGAWVSIAVLHGTPQRETDVGSSRVTQKFHGRHGGAYLFNTAYVTAPARSRSSLAGPGACSHSVRERDRRCSQCQRCVRAEGGPHPHDGTAHGARHVLQRVPPSHRLEIRASVVAHEPWPAHQCRVPCDCKWYGGMQPCC